eukprot:6386891-Pyramimonas_sp.AAC.1
MVPYLETTLYFTMCRATHWTVHKNEAFAFTGDLGRLAKQSVVPYLGRFPPTFLKQHRAELRG